MNPTQKRIEFFDKHPTACYFCGKQIRSSEIEDVEFSKTSDGKETLYFHRRCFSAGQRSALAGMKEGHLTT